MFYYSLERARTRGSKKKKKRTSIKEKDVSKEPFSFLIKPFYMTSTTTTASASNSNYSSAFPPLQAFPWAFPTQANNKKAQKKNTTTNTPSISLSSHSNNSNINYYSHSSFTPPKYPVYLKHTAYATLVNEQYHHLHNKRNSRSNSCLEYNRELEEIDLRLPQYWNKKDKSRHLQVGLNGFDLHYNTGKYYV